MKAFLIPENYDLPPTFVEVEGDDGDYATILAICEPNGIPWPTRVTTQNGKNNDFVTVVDDNSADGSHYVNRRATQLSGYPGQLYGDVLFFSEDWVDDGIDYVTLKPKAEVHFTEYLSLPTTKH